MKSDLNDENSECEKCGHKYDSQLHSSEDCTGIQLRQALAENAKLKVRLASWIDAWYEQREIIGRLAWSMPSLLPDSDSKFFQQQWNKFLRAVNYFFPEKSLDKPVEEITVRSYVDPFDNIEE